MSTAFPERKNFKNYILVHGAWHGSWCWHKVAKHIKGLGHTVIAPDLPGHHQNKSDFKEIALARYVKHIEDLARASPKPVVLVGHSMAGVVITQVAENIPDRIDRLIYISAFIPQHGGALLDEEKQASIPTVGKAVTVKPEEHSIVLPLDNPTLVRELFYGKCSEPDTAYALARLQAQPLRPFVEPISISDARYGAVPKLYIECLQDKAIMIQDQRRMNSRIKKIDIASLDTDHSPFFSADRQLGDLICNAPGLK